MEVKLLLGHGHPFSGSQFCPFLNSENFHKNSKKKIKIKKNISGPNVQLFKIKKNYLRPTLRDYHNFIFEFFQNFKNGPK